MSDRLWPVDLSAALPDRGVVGLRAMRTRDRRDYLDLRARNRDWLRPWDPTNPDGVVVSVSFAQMLREQRRAARSDRGMAFALTVDGAFAGQLNLNEMTRRAFRSCTAGYWVGREFAGRGVAPLALALAGDYALGPCRLHRLEVNIRPENTASLAVVRKLGLRDEGLRLRYLHIDGAWRDHRSFAVTHEEVGPGGLLDRVRANLDRTDPRHTGTRPERGGTV